MQSLQRIHVSSQMAIQHLALYRVHRMEMETAALRVIHVLSMGTA